MSTIGGSSCAAVFRRVSQAVMDLLVAPACLQDFHHPPHLFTEKLSALPTHFLPASPLLFLSLEELNSSLTGGAVSERLQLWVIAC